jgi:hypothetical protein
MSLLAHCLRLLSRPGPGTRPGRRPRRVPYRPTVTLLEDRALPSTLFVTNTGDTGVSGDGSLRGEIAAAHSSDTILLAGSLAGKTIVLTHGELFLGKDLTIQGQGSVKPIISGNTTTRVFEVRATVTLTNLAIVNGNGTAGRHFIPVNLAYADLAYALTAAAPDGEGGAIYNAGSLTLQGCTLSDNSAVVSDSGTDVRAAGGALYNAGGATALVRSSTLSGNAAAVSLAAGTALNAVARGGAIFNDVGGTVTVLGSTLSGNSAAVSASAGSTVFQAFAEGGGLYSYGTITVNSSTLSGNSAAVSVSSGSTVSLAEGMGGGIFNSFQARLTVNSSTLSGNAATVSTSSGGDILSALASGGGLENWGAGTASLSGTIVSGNTAALAASDGGTSGFGSTTVLAGGIYNDGTLLLDHSRDTGNVAPEGADLFNDVDGTVTLHLSTVGVLVNP